MFEFLGLGRSKAEKAPVDPGPSTSPPTVHLSATQIEMVRMTLHGVLKLHGIPGTWISGEVVPVHIPGQGEALLLHLEIMHWHDALVLHAPAFQQAMVDGLRRFDPHADQTRYLFSWKFSPQCGCPYAQLPEAGYWVNSEKVKLASIASISPSISPAIAAATSPANAAEARVPFDLPDRDIDQEDDDQGFAPTQIRDPR